MRSRAAHPWRCPCSAFLLLPPSATKLRFVGRYQADDRKLAAVAYKGLISEHQVATTNSTSEERQHLANSWFFTVGFVRGWRAVISGRHRAVERRARSPSKQCFRLNVDTRARTFTLPSLIGPGAT